MALIIREIEAEDYHKGFMDVINVFTRYPRPISFDEFTDFVTKAKNQNAIILVAEQDKTIVGTIKVLKEYKLHNNLTMMAHIEDVGVHPDFRHQQIGTTLLNKALTYTKDCYKTVLSCKPELVPFYQQHEFAQVAVAVTLYRSTSS
jgi:glucosamine-phosphate N-acetyltransferase